MRNWKVLVTGSAGLVGRYMVEALERRHAEVYTCDSKVDGDMLEILPKLDIKFDLVVHLAGHNGGRRVINGSPMNLAKNIAIDAALFDWAVRTQQKRVLYFSDASAYPVQFQDGLYPSRLAEEAIEYGEAAEPDSHYGWAKLTGERLAYAAMASNIQVYIVRPFNMYASDQSDRHPYPTFLKQTKERQTPFEIWGSQDQVRDWIHVMDVVRGSIAVVEHEVDMPINLCTGIGTSLADLAIMMGREIGFTPKISSLSDMPSGPHHRVGEPSAFHRVYRPRIDLEWSVKLGMRFTAPEAKPRG